MYELIPYEPPKARRNRWKTVTAVICAVALMLTCGYVGAQIVSSRNDPVLSDAPSTDVSLVNATDNSTATLPTLVSNDRTLTLPELFEGANPAVVAISTETVGHNIFGHTVTRPASGSGFFISSDGYIVTNDHVIAGADSITALLYDGTEHQATVVGRDAASDLAIIKIEAEGLTYLTLGDSDTLQVGEQVVAIGNPLGEFANSMTVGHVSALSRDITIDGVSRNKLQTDTAVNPGNSGGPLLNLQGEVIGVVSAKSVGANVEGLGFAIPAAQAQRVIDELVQHGYIRRAVLGISVATQSGTGLVQIAEINPGSAAERAGLLPGDIILAVGGAEITGFSDLRAVLDALSPGDTAEVRVLRGIDVLDLVVVLDSYQPEEPS